MKSRQRLHPRAPKAAEPADPYHHGDLRRVLLDAALAMIAKEGRAALSLRELARRAGVSHAAPYRHFPTKEHLLAAVAEEGFREMKARMEAERAKAVDAASRLAATGLGYVLFAVEHPAHFQVMFDPLDCDDATLTGLREAGQATYGLLLSSLADGQREGAIRAGDPNALALLSWSAVHGLAHLVIGGTLGETLAATTPRAVATRLLADLFEGLRSEAPRKKR